MTSSLLLLLDLNGRAVEVGTAYFSRRRNTLSTSFEYAPDYLRRKGARAFDPNFGLYSGKHHTAGLPGALADSAPDRWGRNLITKKVQAEAARDGRVPPSLSDVDFLVGVSDLTRQGALRLQATSGGPFLSPDPGVPKLVELPRLLRAAEAVARDGDDLAAIKALLDAGSGSLGGARPKASVRDETRLLIAKFPHPGDEWDVMAWEKTALDLAEQAGIDVPRRELLTIDAQSVLVLERFDREHEHRIAYISAMTLIDGRDGDVRDYIEIAEVLPEHSARTSQDLRELWRRIAFSIVIHNTDDHLRNHGFLRDRAGWRLSPAFDINPNPNVSEERVTGVGGARTRADALAALMRHAGTFDLTETDAKQALREVKETTRSWRAVATANGIDRSEQNRFTDAFEGLGAAVETLAGAASSRSTASPGQRRVPRGDDGAGRFAPRAGSKDKPRPDSQPPYQAELF